MLLGQVSTAGIDGKLVSNLNITSDFRFTPLLLKSIFEYVPFSFLVVFLFVCCLNLHSSAIDVDFTCSF